MSKQSNEIYAATDDRDPTTRNLSRRDQRRPNRDEFSKAQQHADDVLGLDEKVSDGLRRSLARFANSPLTLMMEILNDPEQPWDRRENAAHRAFPYLHRKLEDKHGTAAAGGGGTGGGGGSGSTGPTINLTVNRPKVTVNERHKDSVPRAAKQQTTSAKHEQQQKDAARPKAFKKPKKRAAK